MTDEHTRFVTVGESLVDIVLPLEGEPITAPGGSSMNVAVGLARLEVPTLLFTEVGDDPHGLLVAEHVRASGVELGPGSVRSGHRTSTATARLDSSGAASYDFDLTWSLESQRLPDDVHGVHVGSIGAVIEPGRAAVIDLLRQARDRESFVSYDPNIRPDFLPDWEAVAEVAGYANVVKLSDEDVELLRPETSMSRIAHDLLRAEQTRLVVVTRGGKGAMAFTREENIEVAAPRTDLVDTVGAGDSFMAALVAVLLAWATPGDLDAGRLRQLLESATQAAAITVARRGANPPTRQELPPGWAQG